MPTNGSYVNFRNLTTAQYAALTSKDVNTLYWLSDVNQVYVGESLYAQPVIETTDFSAITTPAQGTLYVNTTTYESRVYIGSAWKVISLPIATSTSSDDDTLLTMGVAKSLVNASTAGVTAISYVETDHALSITANGTTTSLALSDLVSSVTYDGEGNLTINAVGKTAQTLNIGKENFLSAASFDEDTNELTLTLSNGTSFAVDLADLVDVYTFTAGSGIEVGGTSNAPTFAVKIDSASTADVLSTSSAGVKIDLTAYALASTVSAIAERATALEGLVGTTAVATQISTAIATSESTLKGDVADAYNTLGKLEDAIIAETSRATSAESTLTTNATALAGRVTTLESEMDAVEGRLDTVEGKVTTLEGEMDTVEAAAAANAASITTINTSLAAVETALKWTVG